MTQTTNHLAHSPRGIARRWSLLPLIVFATMTLACLPVEAQTPSLQLQANQRISIIGNGLADRMQHDGWLETYLHATHPEHQLVIRNLGFAGDTLNTRLRSHGFGSPDHWLTKCQTDVVFAFFGNNEAWQRGEGLPQFQRDLEKFVQHTLSQQYNGQSSPQLVLFTPIKQTRDPRGINPEIERYSEIMKQVGRAKGVPVIDLWSLNLSDADTINGLHLTESGNRKLARTIITGLFGDRFDGGVPDGLREAVLDKNFHWFHRYRATDGYSTYGGRADLAFTDGQTNREVMDRELEILEWLTAERDKRVWAKAQGGDYALDDSQSPPFIPVITNKPGPLPGGKHEFLSGQAAIEKMEVHAGLQVNLFASEEQFPELASPVQMSFDSQGRLWVAVWPSYPHWKPKDNLDDKLLIFTDNDGDGQADDMQVFADGLHNPTGFEFWNGGVLVAQAPYIWFLKDTDGDDVADVRTRVLHAIDSADTHHTANSFVLGPGGGLYFQEGTFHHTQIESPWGPPLRCINAGVYRFEPRTFKVDSYISYNFANPHGHVFDHWGQDFVTDGTGNVNYYAAPFSGKVHFPYKHRGYFPFFQQWVRPSAATEIIASDHFPTEFQGNYLIANVIGFQGLLHYQIEEEGSGFSATELAPIVRSSDPNFRPVDIEMGPDGGIYFIDWQNPIIGHMQHNLRDPSRDQEHGRVYRITCPDRDLLKPPEIAHAPLPELLELLKSPNSRVRYRTRIELSGRETEAVMAATRQWLAGLDPDEAGFEHHRLEALWVHQHHDVVDADLLQQVANSPEPRARAAAIRVLSYWHDRLDHALALLTEAVNDPSPRVRLEGVRAASFLDSAAAAEVALQALNHPLDRFLRYCLQETINTTQPHWKPYLASGQPFAADNPAGLRFVLERLDTFELSGVARSRPVYEALLRRNGVLHEVRMEAAQGLADLDGKTAQTVLLDMIEKLDDDEQLASQAVLADLAHLFLHGDHHSPNPAEKRQPADDQTAGEVEIQRLTKLATSAKKPVTRQIAYATLINSWDDFDRSWQMATQAPRSFPDFLRAIPLIDQADTRQASQAKVFDLLSQGLPSTIAEQVVRDPAVEGRFVRIELPGDQRTLTLAEVEVLSGGKNIAAKGSAEQSATAHGGEPDRAIDGNTNGSYSSGTQTHTPENRQDPWWELDLGREQPIESITIWNRTEGDLGKRLDGFNLKILDENRQTVFEKKGMAAPDQSVSVEISDDLQGVIERAAIEVLPATGGDQASAFTLLSQFVLDDRFRAASIRSLARLPRNSWQDDALQPLIENIIQQISAIPVADRTQPHVLDELALGKTLAAALPKTIGDQLRSQLGELGVNVIILRPVPHQMLYDRTQIYAEAGKPVQIVLENTDIMPHNIVITTPGAHAQVGLAAEMMATESAAANMNYVPDMPEVLHASPMLQPGQIARLDIIAPSEPGDYSYVCTFPGHWRRMYGVFHVVEDLSEIPAEALAPTVEPTIAARPFVRDWKMEDLVTDLPQLDDRATDSSFARGRQLFADMSCIQCHKIDDADQQGGAVGPTLLELKQKLDRGEIDRAGILLSIIEPSETIDDKYRTVIIQDIDGRVHSGVVGEVTDDTLQLLANPLDQSEPVTIAIDEIEAEKTSPVSIMPVGLLNTMNKQEIFDLLNFLENATDR